MSILEKPAEVAGAVAAVEAEKKINPDALLPAAGVAAVVGFQGGGALASVVGRVADEGAADACAATGPQV